MKWIPMTKRPLDEDERAYYRDEQGYDEAELDEMGIFNCELPEDGQEVLITVYGYVDVDIFVWDCDDSCYFEDHDIGDVTAWMPLPEPYQSE